MSGDSRNPPLSRRVPGATNRPAPEMLISAPTLPSDLVARLRAELGDAQERTESDRQPAAERPERSASAPVTDDESTRSGRAKRRFRRDIKASGTTKLTEATDSAPVHAEAAVEILAADVVDACSDLATAVDPRPVTAHASAESGKWPDTLPRRVRATSDIAKLSMSPGLAKVAAALIKPAPAIEDITQPIPAITATTGPDVVILPAQTARTQATIAVTPAVPQHTAALPPPTRPRRPKSPAGQVPPPVDVPSLPTPAELAKVAAALVTRVPSQDITQPIPAITEASETEVLGPAAEAPGKETDLASGGGVPPTRAREKPANRRGSKAAQGAAEHRRRHTVRKPAAAAPLMKPDQMLRPLFAAESRTVEEVVASWRSQREERRGPSSRFYRVAGVMVSVLVITVVMLLVVIR